MTRASTGKKIGARSEYWRERIAEQERSGMSVQRFCSEQGLTEQSFYLWRKRLRKQQPMRFALVETGAARQLPATEPGLELILATGERRRRRFHSIAQGAGSVARMIHLPASLECICV